MGVPFLHRKLQLFLSVYVDETKMAGTTQNMPKMWATLQKQVELEDPASPLDQVYLGCTQRAGEVSNRIVMEKDKLFSKLIITSTDVKTKMKNSKDITAWSCDMQCPTQNCVERFCELAQKTVHQLHEVCTLSFVDHQVKPQGL